MGSSVWDLLVTLGLDSNDYERGLDSAVSKTSKSTSSIGKDLADMGGKIAAGVGLAVGAAATATGVFLTGAVKDASDLNETVSKAGVVFGKYSVQVTEWGKSSASALGMSTNEALTAAGTYGNLFRAMNMSEGASTDMSKGLVQLGADLASFNNMNPAEVMEKLRAGISGETEPLRSLGVNITAAGIATKAAQMGLVKYGQELTPAAKAQAAYALIMEQTTLAQGDFARTSGGLANQQRIMAAQFENVKATIGTALLPVVVQIATQMNAWLSDPAIIGGLTNIANGIAGFATTVIGYLPQAIAFLQTLPDWFMNNQGIIIGVLAALTAAVVAFGISVIVPLLPVIAVMAGIGLAAYLLYTAWTTNFGGIQEKTAAVWAWLQVAFQNVKAWLEVNIPIALAWLADKWNNVLLPAITSVWNWIQANLIPLFVTLKGWLDTNIPIALDWLKNAWTNVLLPALTDVWNWIKTNLFPLFQSLSNFIGAEFHLAVTNLGKLWTDTLLPALKNVGGYINDTLLPAFKTFCDWVQKNIGPIFTEIGKVITATFGAALHGIEDSIRWIRGQLDALAGGANAANSGSGGKPPDMRASGGPVSGGTPYIVGERGPELFVPNGSGHIIPNGAGGNTYITVNPHYYKGDEPTLMQELSQIMALTRPQ